MATFTYTEIKPEEIIATDLSRDVAEHAYEPMEAYVITIDDKAEKAEALYLLEDGRMGIAWGADATWADVDSLDSGIEMYVNDGEEWNKRN